MIRIILKIFAITFLFLICFLEPNRAQEMMFFPRNDSQFDRSLLQENGESSLQPGIGGKNIFFSLILPGLGQWTAGEKGRAKVFFTAEVILWAGFFGSKAYANTLENDFQTFAAIHAGVNTNNKEAQYWIDVGNANNIYQFNEKRRVQRNLNATYPENGEYDWQWDEESNREEYAELRSNQRGWENTTKVMLGGLILNRIISTVDVIRLIRKRKKAEEDLSYSYFHFDYDTNYPHGETYRLNFTWNF